MPLVPRNNSVRMAGDLPFVEYGLDARDPALGWIRFGGDWSGSAGEIPDGGLGRFLDMHAGLARIQVDVSRMGGWGVGLAAYLLDCREECRLADVELTLDGLPKGLLRMLGLALPGQDGPDGGGSEVALHPVARVGMTVLALRREIRDALAFLGECTLALWRGLRGRAYFRRGDFLLLLQQCGAEALPIVSLISFLVGLILAFVGAVQLERFGASIYVADLVGIAMAREMGCVMVAIVLCGRTGAAFAAHLGTMKVNQELDAFRVFGISTVDLLVLPRLLALVLMIPFLTLYADLVGILGGFVVARVMLGISVVEYWDATANALTFAHLGVGVAKSVVFGCIVAFTGCLRGLGCGTNAAAVGSAATSAVVVAITGVVAADALFAVVFNVLGI
jgi:phospholipid/cholesterol/gamma-HCH transport system permease protein